MHCLESVAGADAIVDDVVLRAKHDLDDPVLSSDEGVGVAHLKVLRRLVGTANAEPNADPITMDEGQNQLFTVIELAKRDNDAAKAALDAAARHVGAALGQLVAILNPKTIVIGGAFGPTAYPLITAGLGHGLDEHVRGAARDDMDLRTGQHTGQAAVRGAIALVLETQLASFFGRLMSEAGALAAHRANDRPASAGSDEQR
jgi:predicted NBD/HSP70 family sugar kinase